MTDEELRAEFRRCIDDNNDDWYADYRRDVEAEYEVVGDMRFSTPEHMPWPQTFNRWMGAAKVTKLGVHVADLRGRGDPVGVVIVMSDGERSRELLVSSKDEALSLIKKLGPLPSAEAIDRVWKERGGDDFYD